MKNRLSFFLITLILMTLTGCIPDFLRPDPIVIVEYKLKTPPDSLLMDCDFVPPPPMSEYLFEKEWANKEKMWVDNKYDSIAATTICNLKFKALRDWKVKEVKLWEESDVSSRNKGAAKGE